jgi:glycosyltransferase involved in cell wall biosynthesis
MSRRRVLVFNHFAVPLGEPGGTRHTELFSQLHGWDHLIVAARTNPSTRKAQQDRPGFRFVAVTPFSNNGLARIGNWISYAIAATWTSMVNLRRHPDVVYASSPHLLAGVAGAVVAGLFRVPLILEVRDMWPKILVDMGQLKTSSPVYKILARLESWLYHRADRIVVLADGVGKTLVETGVPANKITLIPNAADPEYFETGLTREQARAAYGFEKLTFVYTGAHGPANGLELLLEAASTISEPSVEIVLVGDGVERPNLIRQSIALKLTNVRFLDPIPKAEIPRLLQAADVGVHCLADIPLFHYGVSPNKVFDYMAAGRPVLTNTPGDVRGIVELADGGLAVSPHGLADGISQMVHAGEVKRLAWGTHGRRFMSQRQSRKAMICRLNTLLNDVVPPKDNLG